MPSDLHFELCARLGVPGSDRLARVWEVLCDETDARLILAMPATAAELGRKTGLPGPEVEGRLKDLFQKGVTFEAAKGEGIVYRGPRHLPQFHDATVQWAAAPRGFYELWNEFMVEENPAVVLRALAAGMPSFMRAVPALGTLEGLADVRPYEDVGRMIDDAEEIAVVRCPCRLSMRRCDAPVETCVQFDRGARYNVKRGTGRRIGGDEALGIVRRAEEAGLVHLVENRGALGNVLCNCCTCCCAMMRPYLMGADYRPIVAPSRFAVSVDPALCASDEVCVEICPTGAVSAGDGAVQIDQDLCLGCGLCVAHCTGGALSLTAARPPGHIPA